MHYNEHHFFVVVNLLPDEIKSADCASKNHKNLYAMLVKKLWWIALFASLCSYYNSVLADC